jgi:hypothetical protein
MAAIQVPIIAVYALPEGRRLAMKQALWRRAEEFFHAGLERPPEARQAFLDEACGEDTELWRHVGMFVSKDEHAGSFLGKSAFADITAAPGTRGSLVGREFGNRHLDRDIAMIGKVIKARGIGWLLRIFPPRNIT